jgi:hypothetical protein
MAKLLDRLFQMAPRPGMYLGRESPWAVWVFIYGYEAAAEDSGAPCDELRGFDEWVNLRMLLPPGATAWPSRLLLAADTTHKHAYPDARGMEQRACRLFFDWLKEFVADRDARGADAIIAEHDSFDWPEIVEPDEAEVGQGNILVAISEEEKNGRPVAPPVEVMPAIPPEVLEAEERDRKAAGR